MSKLAPRKVILSTSKEVLFVALDELVNEFLKCHGVPSESAKFLSKIPSATLKGLSKTLSKEETIPVRQQLADAFRKSMREASISEKFEICDKARKALIDVFTTENTVFYLQNNDVREIETYIQKILEQFDKCDLKTLPIEDIAINVLASLEQEILDNPDITGLKTYLNTKNIFLNTEKLIDKVYTTQQNINEGIQLSKEILHELKKNNQNPQIVSVTSHYVDRITAQILEQNFKVIDIQTKDIDEYLRPPENTHEDIIEVTTEKSKYFLHKIDDSNFKLAVDAIMKDNIWSEFLPKKTWGTKTIYNMLESGLKKRKWTGYAYIFNNEIIAYADFQKSGNDVEIGIAFVSKKHRREGLVSALIRFILLENYNCDFKAGTFENNFTMRGAFRKLGFDEEREKEKNRINDTNTVYYSKTALLSSKISELGIWKPSLFFPELRANELVELDALLKEKKVIFVTGDGGNGKTELVKHYCYERLKINSNFNYYFIEYMGSLANTFEKLNSDEKIKAHPGDWKAVLNYFKKHKCLLIIDNFNRLSSGGFAIEDEMFNEVIKYNSNMIFTTRYKNEVKNEVVELIIDYFEEEKLIELFNRIVEEETGTKIPYKQVDIIINAFSIEIENNGRKNKVCLTIVMVLVAKYLANNIDIIDSQNLTNLIYDITRTKGNITLTINNKEEIKDTFINILVQIFKYEGLTDSRLARKILTCICILPDSQALNIEMILRLIDDNSVEAKEIIEEMSRIRLIIKFDNDGKILMHSVVADAIAKQLNLKAEEDDCKAILKNLLNEIKSNEATKRGNAQKYSAAINRFEGDSHPLVLEFLCELAFLLSWSDKPGKCEKYLLDFWEIYTDLSEKEKYEATNAYYSYCNAMQDHAFTNEWFHLSIYYNRECQKFLEENPNISAPIKMATHLINEADAKIYLADYSGNFPAYFLASGSSSATITEKQARLYEEAKGIASKSLAILNENELEITNNKGLKKCEVIEDKCEYCIVIARALKAIAYAYNGLGKELEAYKYAESALEYYGLRDEEHKINLNPDTLRVDDLIGLIQMNSKNEVTRKSAYEKFKSVYDSFRKMKNIAFISQFRNIHSLALSCYYSDNLTGAISYGDEAIKLNIHTQISPPRKAACYYNLGMVYLKYDTSREHAKRNINEAYRILIDCEAKSHFMMEKFQQEDCIYGFEFQNFKKICKDKITEIKNMTLLS